MRQEGPNDNETNDVTNVPDAGDDAKDRADEPTEVDEYVVGVARDIDTGLDADRHADRAQILLLKQIGDAQKTAAHEEEMRATHPNYCAKGMREHLASQAKKINEFSYRASIKDVAKELEKLQAKLEPQIPPPCGVAPATHNLSSGEIVLSVPSKKTCVDSFDPSVWTKMDPKCFIYGDGVWGIERETRMTFRQWIAYLMDRDELEYSGGADWYALARGSAAGVDAAPPACAPRHVLPPRRNQRKPKVDPGRVPRWRGARDLLTVAYDMWRRRNYLMSGRLQAERKHWNTTMAEVSRLSAADMWKISDHLGKNAGWKELLSDSSVPSHLKSAVNALQYIHQDVLGTCAHRQKLRHTDRAYCNLFGSPLIWTTPNMDDRTNPMMKLFYEGEEVRGWRTLEEHAPAMPAWNEMMRRAARDPVSMAVLFEIMMELLLKHLFGVDRGPKARYRNQDGAATEYWRGIFGPVQAYHGPIETNGRGGLHGHFHVWLVTPLNGTMLDQLRKGAFDDDMIRRITNWQRDVLAQVGSVQFECVEEIARQLGVPKREVRPVPFKEWEQASHSTNKYKGCYVDGSVEPNDVMAAEINDKEEHEKADWQSEVRCPPCGPARVRPLVPVNSDMEGDPGDYFNRDTEGLPLPSRYLQNEQAQTGGTRSLNPQFRRKPQFFISHADGRVEIIWWGEGNESDRAVVDAKRWARVFFSDARKAFIRNHYYKCGKSCWKYCEKRGQMVQICRYRFAHNFRTTVYPRKTPWAQATPAKCCPMGERCTLIGARILGGEHAGELVHPKFCPQLPSPEVTQQSAWRKEQTLSTWRVGKQIVAPREKLVATDGTPMLCKLYTWPTDIDDDWRDVEQGGALDYTPHLADDDEAIRAGDLGRAQCLRTNPKYSSANPVAMVCGRTNWDVVRTDTLATLRDHGGPRVRNKPNKQPRAIHTANVMPPRTSSLDSHRATRHVAVGAASNGHARDGATALSVPSASGEQKRDDTTALLDPCAPMESQSSPATAMSVEKAASGIQLTATQRDRIARAREEALVRKSKRAVRNAVRGGLQRLDGGCGFFDLDAALEAEDDYHAFQSNGPTEMDAAMGPWDAPSDASEIGRHAELATLGEETVGAMDATPPVSAQRIFCDFDEALQAEDDYHAFLTKSPEEMDDAMDPWDVPPDDSEIDKDAQVDALGEETDGAMDATHPESAQPEASVANGHSSSDLLYRAFTRALVNAINRSFYNSGYSTKYAANMSSLCQSIAHGLDGMEAIGRCVPVKENTDAAAEVDSYKHKRFETKRTRKDLAEMVDYARRLLIRMQTSANRTMVKKLTEMAFTMLFNHECYYSHETWTLYGKRPVALAYRAMERRRRRLSGEPSDDLTNYKLPCLSTSRGGDNEIEEADGNDERELGHFQAFLETPTVSKDGGDDCPEKDGGRPADALEGASVGLGAPTPQFDTYLVRGCREPLNAMGLYHYCMWVYEKHQGNADEDFATYRFASLNRRSAQRVQKLRVDECFKVPRLSGLTIPYGGKGASDENIEKAALMKLMLFKPFNIGERFCDPVSGFISDQSLFDVLEEEVSTDGRGRLSYKPAWESWYERQCELAVQFHRLQERSGKKFTCMDHVDMSLTEEEPLGDSRERPSPAEFMARITVDVVTNIEAAAEGKAGPKLPQYQGPDDCEWEDNAANQQIPAGSADHPNDDEKLTRANGEEETMPHYPLRSTELPQASLLETFKGNGRAALAGYKKDFLDTIGKVHRPDVLHMARGALQPYRGTGSAGDEVDFDAKFSRQSELLAPKKTNVQKVNASQQTAPLGEKPRCETWNGEQEEVKFKRLFEDIDVKVTELLDQRAKDGKRMGTDQLAFLARFVDHFRLVLRQTLLREKVSQRVFLLLGQGGTGKSEVLGVARDLVRAYKDVLAARRPGGTYIEACPVDMFMASTNAAASRIDGDTIHSRLHVGGRSNLNAQALTQREVKQDFITEWTDVHLLVVDGISMLSPCLLGSASYLLSRARQTTWGADPSLSTEKGEAFGRIPIVILSGDFLQLPAFEAGYVKTSLLEYPKKPPEHLLVDTVQGRRCFRESVTDTHILYETFRFKKGDVLPSILNYMRTTDGTLMSDHLWTALKARECTGPKDSRLALDGFKNGYEVATQWEAVARLMHYRARRDSRAAGQLLFYLQAVDKPKEKLQRRDYMRALEHANYCDAGNRMGLCPLYVGMPVRLTTKLNAKLKLVNEAVGTVVGFEFGRNEFSDGTPGWLANERDDSENRLRGYVCLKEQPQAVYVKFDKLEGQNLCGFGEGIVAVAPKNSDNGGLTYHTLAEADLGSVKKDVKILRYQSPLMPAPVRTTQTSQGMSMEFVKLFLARGQLDAGSGEYWLNVYVMLSRARSLEGMLLWALPSREWFASGPPEWIVNGMRDLEVRAAEEMEEVRKLVQKYPWAQVDANVAPDVSAGHATPSHRTPCGEKRTGSDESIGTESRKKRFRIAETTITTGPTVGKKKQDTSDVAKCTSVRSGSDDSAARDSAVVARLENLRQKRPMTEQITLQQEYRMLVHDCPRRIALPPVAPEMIRTDFRPVGLMNPCADICFINASMQVLLRLEPLRHVLMADGHRCATWEDGCAWCCARELARQVRSESVTAPLNCLATLARRGRFGEEFARKPPRESQRTFSARLKSLRGCMLPESEVVDDNGVARRGSQGCASEFVEQFLNQLHLEEKTCHSSREADRCPMSVVSDELFGNIVRVRRCYPCCGAVIDESIVERRLPVFWPRGEDPVDKHLRDLWKYSFEPRRDAGTRPCPVCGAQEQHAVEQRFLEREAPCLLIHVDRRQWDAQERPMLDATGAEVKLHNRVQYQSQIEWGMKSGRYEFVGAVHHHGVGPGKSGHYTATCLQQRRRAGSREAARVDDAYCHIDDSVVTSPLKWSDMTKASYQRSAFLLLYTRVTSSPHDPALDWRKLGYQVGNHTEALLIPRQQAAAAGA